MNNFVLVNKKIHLVQIMPLQEAFQRQAKKVILRIFLPGIEESVFENLKGMLEKYKWRCPVLFELETPHAYRMLVQSVEIQGVSPSEELTKNVETLLGEGSVVVEY